MKNPMLFSENRLIYRGGPKGGPESAGSSAEKISPRICKQADAKYFNVINKVGKLSAKKFEKRLKGAVLPKAVKKAAKAEVEKTKYLYPTKEALEAKINKVAASLLQLINKEGITLQHLDDLRGQAQGDIKRTAQKEAGYSGDTTSDTEATIGTGGMTRYKGIISKMNGKVPKQNLLKVAKGYKKIAIEGLDSAIATNAKVVIENKIKKHMTTALNA